MDVDLVRWPDERHRRETLVAEGRPRLLLVEAGVAPPEPPDCLEDWVRLPATDDDVRHRARAVTRRAVTHGSGHPHLDDDGVLRVGRSRVVLPPIEARITAELLARGGGVVSRQALMRAGWPDGSAGRNSLDVQMMRLRRRLAPSGLSVRTVRARGYLLEVTSDRCQEPVEEA